MIHDKDYMMRLVRQFSELLAKLILGKNEGRADDIELVIETQMKDIFKMDFEALAAKSQQELIDFVEEKEERHKAEYYELLGHLFYYKGKQQNDNALIKRSVPFYESYLTKSGIFSMPVISRINEIKQTDASL